LLVVSAMAYWSEGVATTMGLLVLPMYVIGVATYGPISFRSYRRHFPDPDLSSRENRWLAVAGQIMAWGVMGPMLVWGSLACFALKYPHP
jgi:hypothetical protein